MRFRVKYFPLFLFFWASVAASAQDDFTNQLWLDFNPKWNLGEHTFIRSQIGYRTISTEEWNRYVFRAEYNYSSYNLLFKSDKIAERIVGGVGLFLLQQPRTSNTTELRPMQGYQVNYEMNEVFTVKQLLRFEERIHFSQNDTVSTEFGFRIRYRIGADIMLKRLLYKEGVGFYLPLHAEFFWNVKSIKQFNDVIRLMPGLGYQFNSDFRLQFNLSYQFVNQDIGAPARSNDIVFRFRVYKTLFW